MVRLARLADGIMVGTIATTAIITAVATSVATIAFVLSRIRSEIVVMLVDIAGNIESCHCIRQLNYISSPR